MPGIKTEPGSTWPCPSHSFLPTFKPQLTDHLLLGVAHPLQAPLCPTRVTQPCNYLFPGPPAHSRANSAPAHSGSLSRFEQQHNKGLRTLEPVFQFQIPAQPLTSCVILGMLLNCSVPQFPCVKRGLIYPKER